MHACSLLKGRTNKKARGVSSFLKDFLISWLSALCCLGNTDGRMRAKKSKKKKDALLHTVDLWRLLELVSSGLPS